MGKEKYVEPSDFIPKSIRKELKLGEFSEEEKKEKEKRELNQKFRDYVNKRD